MFCGSRACSRRAALWLSVYTRRNHIAAGSFSKPLNYLDGRRVDPECKDELPLLEPATGDVLGVVKCSGQSDVDKAVFSAREAFNVWSDISGFDRGQIMHKAASLVRDNFDDFVNAEVTDTGKPIWEARADIQGCTDALDYFAGVAPTIMGTTIQLPKGTFNYTLREPLGVCGAIGAWNYPFQMATFKAAPALACGNTMVFKPSPLTPLTAVMLAETFTQAGVPDGVFNVIQGETATGVMLNASDVNKMTFTGSVETGKKIMEASSKTVKHVTLELGGKSPLLIFDDCSLENAVKGALVANFLTQGQVCSNATRVFVQRNILKQFLDKVVERTKRMKIGDPFDDDTTVGAMITEDHAHKVLGYIEGARKEGVSILHGGERVTLANRKLAGGYYLSPCVMADVEDAMTVAKEEVFGSVMSVMSFETEEEAIRRANDTHLGLAGGVFTKDIQRAHRVIRQLQAGSLYINNYNLYPPGVPFGGYKQSGLGRENALETVQHFTQIKSVYVEMNDVDCPF